MSADPSHRRPVRVAAVDLGASSGRVLAAEVGPGRLAFTEVHRFANTPVSVAGRLYWDVLGLYRNVLDGLTKAAAGGPVDSIGIDSWAVDYGLLDADGRLLANPVCYRDGRTVGVPERVWNTIPPAELYALTGIQYQRFNTIYQLAAERADAHWPAARTMLLLPDLLGYWLTGRTVAEVTNASTTQLVDAQLRQWAPPVFESIGLEPGLLPELVEPGQVIGPVRCELADELGLRPDTPVVAVASHDTASAVVAVPMQDRTGAAFISSGTWSLVGLELDEPVLSEASRAANVTNELGADGTVRYLRNVMGLWILQECERQWRAAGHSDTLADLLAAAEQAPSLGVAFDADDDRFLAPGRMADRVGQAVRESTGHEPTSRGQIVRCVLDALAGAYARAIADECALAGRRVDVVHIVGGGSLNRLLCQLTADAVGVPVEAGPVEATGIGNALIQARAIGAFAGEPDALADLRALVRTTHEVTRFVPRSGMARAEFHSLTRKVSS